MTWLDIIQARVDEEIARGAVDPQARVARFTSAW
jgi:hypothetical protein